MYRDILEFAQSSLLGYHTSAPGVLRTVVIYTCHPIIIHNSTHQKCSDLNDTFHDHPTGSPNPTVLIVAAFPIKRVDDRMGQSLSWLSNEAWIKGLLWFLQGLMIAVPWNRVKLKFFSYKQSLLSAVSNANEIVSKRPNMVKINHRDIGKNERSNQNEKEVGKVLRSMARTDCLTRTHLSLCGQSAPQRETLRWGAVWFAVSQILQKEKAPSNYVIL